MLLFTASTWSTVLSTQLLWCFVSARVLCLGVWESSGCQRPWQFCLSDQTHPRCDFHNTEPKQTGGPRRLLDRVSVTTGLFSDSLHHNTFQNMPTAMLSLPKSFKLLFGSVNIPGKHISTYVQHHISRIVCVTEEQHFSDLLVLVRYCLFSYAIIWMKGISQTTLLRIIYSKTHQHQLHCHFSQEKNSFKMDYLVL